MYPTTYGLEDKLTVLPEIINGTRKENMPDQDQKFTTARVNDPDMVKDQVNPFEQHPQNSLT